MKFQSVSCIESLQLAAFRAQNSVNWPLVRACSSWFDRTTRSVSVTTWLMVTAPELPAALSKPNETSLPPNWNTEYNWSILEELWNYIFFKEVFIVNAIDDGCNFQSHVLIWILLLSLQINQTFGNFKDFQ